MKRGKKMHIILVSSRKIVCNKFPFIPSVYLKMKSLSFKMEKTSIPEYSSISSSTSSPGRFSARQKRPGDEVELKFLLTQLPLHLWMFHRLAKLA